MACKHGLEKCSICGQHNGPPEMDNVNVPDKPDPDQVSKFQMLQPRQAMAAESKVAIAKTFGKWDQSKGPDGAGYKPASDNPYAAEGLMCKSCVFFQAPNGCSVVSGDVEESGVCRLFEIPGELMMQEEAPQEAMMVDEATDDMNGGPEPEMPEMPNRLQAPNVPHRLGKNCGCATCHKKKKKLY